MSQQDVQTIRGGYEAFNRTDIPAVLNVFDAQIEWIEPGGGRAPVGTFTGPQSVADKVFALVPQNFDEFQAEPQQFIDSGEHVVVVGQFRGRSKGGGGTLDAPFVHVWRMRNGKAVRFQHYVEGAAWARAWGGQIASIRQSLAFFAAPRGEFARVAAVSRDDRQVILFRASEESDIWMATLKQ